jgi:hypothetical protein
MGDIPVEHRLYYDVCELVEVERAGGAEENQV